MSFSFNLTDSEINKDSLKYLYEEFLQIAIKDPEEKRFVVQRFVKVNELDVKLNIKLEVNIDIFSDINVISKLSMSSENVTLRKCKVYYSDIEFVKLKMEVKECPDQLGVLDQSLNDYVMKVIQHMNTFKVCGICRLLYRDPRIEEKISICRNCYFDRCFFEKKDSCIICQEKYKSGDFTFSLTCGHIYHSNCILHFFLTKKKRECPVCKEIDSHQISV